MPALGQGADQGCWLARPAAPSRLHNNSVDNETVVYSLVNERCSTCAEDAVATIAKEPYLRSKVGAVRKQACVEHDED